MSRRGFSLIEVLIVVMLISAGILPIYSLIKSGQKRIIRADSRTIATLYGASALELVRTIGFQKAMKLRGQGWDSDPDFKDMKDLCDNARKNGFDVIFGITTQPLANMTKSTRPVFLMRCDVEIRNFNRAFADGSFNPDAPPLKFVTILCDPRFNFY